MSLTSSLLLSISIVDHFAAWISCTSDTRSHQYAAHIIESYINSYDWFFL